MSNAYKKLEKKFKVLSNISGASEILNWDSATMMPKNSASSRSEQISTLSTISHNIIASSEMSDLLDEAESEAIPDKHRAANLKMMRHKWNHATSLDEKFVERYSKAAHLSENIWREARNNDDYERYSPYLNEVIKLVREKAARKSEFLGCNLYDALLDEYDIGRKSADIDVVFADLKSFLPEFIKQVVDKQNSEPSHLPLKQKYPIKAQKNLGLKFMEQLGFDFTRGRIDTSHHPFCGGTPSDVRITTRYDENDFTSALMGVLHETGHSLYEMGLPQKWLSQPIGESMGMTIHESQSLLIEMQLCRGREFIEYAAPFIKEAFGNTKEHDAENLYKLYNHVQPSLIRVDADEVTYPSHVILRYEIEKDLLAAEIEVRDLPEIWRVKMKEMLDVDVSNDKDGCMQDVHWSDGSLGYFPTYSLGAIYAAQFFNAAKLENSDILPQVSKGNFTPLISWLNKNIHEYGSLLNAEDLLKEVTGEKMNISIYKKYLQNKYL